MAPKTKFKLTAIALCALCFAATGHGQSTSISVSPATATVSVGQTQQFTVSGAVTPTGVSSGGEYTCVGLSDGTVSCTGRNQFGQHADGTINNTLTLGPAVNLANVSKVAAGDEFGCALIADGTVMCWGLGESGQIGNGTFNNINTAPTLVSGITTAVAVASGYDHACALLADRTMVCWGSNVHGQLGNPSAGTTASPVPVPVSGLSGVASFATGAYHTCAVVADATLQCWGKNDNGQLGNGTRTSSPTPIPVDGLSNVAVVSGGGDHTCAVLTDRTVRCWGENEFGQLGNGTTLPSMTPDTVVGLTDAVAIAAGWRHVCALVGDGSLRCWGENDYGELGNGTTASSSTPVGVEGIASAVGVTAGWWHHSCALLGDATVRCWGANEWGQLGSGTTTNAAAPVLVAGSGITWTSSDSSVATTAASGLTTAVNSGAASITATDTTGASASATLTVRQRAALSVLLGGGGAGRVTAAPAGIDCGSDCSELYDVGTTIALTPSPDGRSTFGGWTGCDSVSGVTCTVTVNAATTVQARFDLKQFTLTVTRSGLAASQGRITSSPQGIDCGADCSEPYTIDTVVTLTATPDLLLNGWTGCDTVSGATCTVSMSRARAVTANFVGMPF
jgi:alpha-tubulin suppressor-like RCC1 family protein